MTPRQLQVLQLLCKGFCNKEIADKMSITFETVKKHKRDMFDKSGAKNSAQLVYIAMQQGLIS